MSTLPEIKNPASQTRVNAETDMQVAEAGVRLAQGILDKAKERVEKNTRREGWVQSRIDEAFKHFIDFPITRLDWSVAKIEATHKLCERNGIYEIPAPGFPDTDILYNTDAEARVAKRGRFRSNNEGVVETEAKEVVKEALANSGIVLGLYWPLLSRIADEKEKVLSYRSTIYPHSDITGLSTHDRRKAIETIVGELPGILPHAIDVKNQGVALESILAPLREGSARAELEGMDKPSDVTDAAKLAFEALKPLRDLRRQHLQAFLAVTAPKQAA